MERLYVLSQAEDEAKSPLYVRGGRLGADLAQGQVLDLCTYFNSFSLAKWRRYTTLASLVMELELAGTFQIAFFLYDAKGRREICQEQAAAGIYRHEFAVAELDGVLLGCELTALSEGSCCQGGAYLGEFADYRSIRIGVGICTFKREEYVRRTIRVLQDMREQGAAWLETLVVDNGRTLEAVDKPGLRIVMNRNFGGSGGFTRAMLEYVARGEVDYVLLMDDDIVLEPTVLQRSYALLSGLREDYRESFLAGAMLSLERPAIQHENTAYWDKIRRQPIGKGLDLSAAANLVANEEEAEAVNRYGAWWYCCLPLPRIRELGYSLPLFIKGDDIEYSLRNRRPLMTMDGIGVWHQDFAGKMSPVVNYYSDRGMLMLNDFAEGCGWLTYAVSVLGRLARSLRRGRPDVKMFALALRDFDAGFEEMTQVGADEKMASLGAYAKEAASPFVMLEALGRSFLSIARYPLTRRRHRDFREKQLRDGAFWKRYLGLEA